MPPLCPKLLLRCGNLTPASVPLSSDTGPVLLSPPLFSSSFSLPSFVLPSFVWIHIPFWWSGTPASFQLVLCEILCFWICIANVSLETVVHVQLFLCHLDVLFPSAFFLNHLSITEGTASPGEEEGFWGDRTYWITTLFFYLSKNTLFSPFWCVGLREEKYFPLYPCKFTAVTPVIKDR